jgi:hypothetical protein
MSLNANDIFYREIGPDLEMTGIYFRFLLDDTRLTRKGNCKGNALKGIICHKVELD